MSSCSHERDRLHFGAGVAPGFVQTGLQPRRKGYIRGSRALLCRLTSEVLRSFIRKASQNSIETFATLARSSTHEQAFRRGTQNPPPFVDDPYPPHPCSPLNSALTHCVCVGYIQAASNMRCQVYALYVVYIGYVYVANDENRPHNQRNY